MKKYYKIVLTLCLLMVVVISNSIATSTSYSVNLEPSLLPTTAANGTKSNSSDQNATNIINYMGGDYYRANAWIDDERGSKAADTVRTYYGNGTHTMPYNRKVRAGEYLKLRMSNVDWTYVRVRVEGYVNFK